MLITCELMWITVDKTNADGKSENIIIYTQLYFPTFALKMLNWSPYSNKKKHISRLNWDGELLNIGSRLIHDNRSGNDEH